MATEHFGKTDPLDLDEYIIRGGFAALGMCLENANDETRKSNTEADGAGVRPSRAQQRDCVSG